MHVVSNDGRILFSGSRRDCKQFIRKNNVKQYKLKEHFSEKVVVIPEVEEKSNPLSEPETVEGFFNKVFD
jgi:hypothetical protein